MFGEDEDRPGLAGEVLVGGGCRQDSGEEDQGAPRMPRQAACFTPGHADPHGKCRTEPSCFANSGQNGLRARADVGATLTAQRED